MTTRKSVEDFLQTCKNVISTVEEQYYDGQLQEHPHDEGYTGALMLLEQTYNQLTELSNSANAQQKEQLHRMRLQLQQLQNKMILSP
ncbi:YtzC family protein [Bacillaceae bacterium Marseille-Q3522]|nr:YtzC family protein [Bacillaceae bacterium Marseille-Q3522]